jgi:hypothetical protein
MKIQIHEFVQTCKICQKTKVKQVCYGELHPHGISTELWEVISIDLIEPLPKSAGYNVIQVFADTGSKEIHIEPVNIEIDALGVAKLLRDQVIRYHRIPKKIILDKDTRYASNFMTELYKLIGVQANISTAYHLQTDGQTERANQEIEAYLRAFINIHQTDCVEWLLLARFSYNDKVNSSINETLFKYLYGYDPWKEIKPRIQSRNDIAKEFAERMKTICDEAAACFEKAM